MKQTPFIFALMILSSMFSCSSPHPEKNAEAAETDTFKYAVEKFADLNILRYRVPDFDSLSLKQKELVYYLSQATLAGRDIIYDQNGKYNLAIRRTLDAIVLSYKGDRNTDDFHKFMVYTKRVWFSNGIYHHYASDKFTPGFSKEYFASLVNSSDASRLPLSHGKTTSQLLELISPVMFDPHFLPKKVNQDSHIDMIKNSAVNFYEGVTQMEVEDYYAPFRNKKESEPVSYGLNTRVVKENGKIIEKPYKIGGVYGEAISEIVKWLSKAVSVAENAKQKEVINKLIEYYQTGDLKTWDAYNILWVEDLNSRVDFINGFIENYEDPLSMKATWEAVVNFKNLEATHRTETISAKAQWFEDHSPVDKQFKKKKVKGVTAKVITVVQLGGDNSPATAIGINLPNADWIRKEYGSKSVTLDNITYAYDKASQGNGFIEEFSYDKKEIDIVKKYGYLTDNLHTDLHECLGHGSGQLLPGVSPEALKNYQSTLEEARADLFGLYYLGDKKMVELKLIPDTIAAEAEYIKYIRNGLMTQLTRIQPGKNIEEAHMRNRQLIAKWCFEKGASEKVIEKVMKDGKTYFRINDFGKLRQLFGQLLAEVQRIKSEGDYESGKKLVETYAVSVDPQLHKEVLERYGKLNLAPYSGFLNPELIPVEKEGKIVDVKIEYPDDFTKQMLKYGKEHSFLPE